MNSANWSWKIAAAAALASTVLFFAGMVYAINDVLNPKAGDVGNVSSQPPAESPVDKNNLQIVALGDSLTKGTGDTTGKGYVGNVRDMLEKSASKQARILGNYGVNGYRTDQLLHDLQTNSTVAQMVRRADIVLLTIGGNDLFAVGRDVFNVDKDRLDPEKLKQRMPEPLNRLAQILDKLAELNPQAAIVYIGLYNPFYDLDESGLGSRQVQEWNNTAMSYAVKHKNMVFVPTFDLFQIHFKQYMYSDHFHPNQLGYERIAARVVQALQ